MLYFAYGSNMHWEQMKERCPSARFVGVAVLQDHRLAFTRYSRKRNGGVADAVSEKGKMVWGVVFEIHDDDVGQLDTEEGYEEGSAHNSYQRQDWQVLLDGDDTRPLAVAVYFAERQESPPLPSQGYKDQILRGARRWRLPSDYIKQLEAIEVAVP